MVTGLCRCRIRNAARNAPPGLTSWSPRPLVSAFVGAVIGSSCDVVLVLRRENLRVGVARQQFHDDPAAGPRDGEGRALVEQGKAIVEVEFAKSGVEPAEVLFLTGWDPAPVEHDLF